MKNIITHRCGWFDAYDLFVYYNSGLMLKQKLLGLFQDFCIFIVDINAKIR